jgi:hypothetical protein
MTGIFKRSLRPRATSRAKKSVDAPGVIPKTILIGLLGYVSSARTNVLEMNSPKRNTPINNNDLFEFIVSSSFIFMLKVLYKQTN